MVATLCSPQIVLQGQAMYCPSTWSLGYCERGDGGLLWRLAMQSEVDGRGPGSTKTLTSYARHRFI
jgi:hypothetical protein